MLDDEADGTSLEDTLLKKHRLELKQLQAQIQKLKKSANKDKKKKKEIQNEISTLEKALHDRQEAELAELKGKTLTQSEGVCEGINALKIRNTDTDEDAKLISEELDEEEAANSKDGKKVTRAERRRQKKAALSKEREQLIKEAERNNQFSARNVEAEKIKVKLKERLLRMHEINPDGNCLYAAIAHQLGPAAVSVSDLRSKAAAYMRLHADDFVPFLTDPSRNELLTPSQFEDYCSKLEATTAWGGQPELRALSQVLKKRIEVLQAEGAPILFGEEFSSEGGVLLAYYRHYYGLGEHYNSVTPLRQESA